MAKITVTRTSACSPAIPKVWPPMCGRDQIRATQELEVEFVPGDLRRPARRGAAQDKFHSFVTPVLGAEALSA